MSNKKLTVLGIVAIVMVIWAVVQSNISNKPATRKAVAAPLVQGLNPEDITVIEVIKGVNKVVFAKKDDGFVISQKDDYPAQNKAINELITKILDIKTTGETLTSNSANFDDLCITEDKAETIVKFFNKENKLITGVAVGKRFEGGQTAVRLINSNDVYTTEDYVWIKVEDTDYIQKDLLNVDSDSIARVKIINAAGEYEMAKDANSSIIKMATAIPDGKQLKSGGYEQVFNALSNFSISNVMAESKAVDFKFDSKFICQMRDTTVYIVESAKKDEKYFIKVSSDFKNRSQVSIDLNEPQEELKKKEMILVARDRADEFAKNHKGWIYEIPSYTADNLRKDFTSLIEDVVKPVDSNNPEQNQGTETIQQLQTQQE